MDEKIKNEDIYAEIDKLNAFSVASRYPGFDDNPELEEACALYHSALKITDLMFTKLKP